MRELLQKAQPQALRILENSFVNNRLSHAYLFVGPHGTYKKEMAYHLALMLYHNSINPCYECDICRTILNGNHLNVFYIEPIGQSIKKEQIMALQEEFSKTSQVPGPRIYIINEADTMSNSAANSLLKFIEDPINEQTYGILITEHRDNILPTIQSRSIIINFYQLDKSVLKEELLKSGLDDKTADVLAYLTNNKSDADSLANSEMFGSVCETFMKFIKQLVDNGPITLFYRANGQVLSIRDNLAMFLELIEGFYRDCLELAINKKVINYPSLLSEISLIADRLSIDELIKYLNLILELGKKLSYNVNINLLVDQLLIDLKGGDI